MIVLKTKIYAGAYQVCRVGNWLGEQTASSKILKNHDIVTISNNIDTSEFLPSDKFQARKSLGLVTNKKIMSGAVNLNDFYKDFDKFLEA